MSFASDCKTEMIESERRECCISSLTYGALVFSREFTRDRISLTSRVWEVVYFVRDRLEEYGVPGECLKIVQNRHSLTLVIDDRVQVDKIMADCGYSGNEPSFRILRENFRCSSCPGAFCAGAFIACGVMADPSKEYILEFTCPRKNLTYDLVELFYEAGVQMKIRNRGNRYIAYIKDSESIVDALTFMGASNSAMDLMNLKIYKSLRNDTNRRVNFESANIDKTVNAAQDDIDAIRYIEENAGLEVLSEELREIAGLRVENPELSLTELGAKTGRGLTKSGVSHRLSKIRSIAAELREGTNGQK